MSPSAAGMVVGAVRTRGHKAEAALGDLVDALRVEVLGRVTRCNNKQACVSG